MKDTEILDTQLERWAEIFVKPIVKYHRYKALGLENIPTEGPCLVVLNHSLATYDGLLLGYKVYHDTGRLPFALGDDLIFKIPKLKALAEQIGIQPATPQNAAQLLKEGRVVFVAPGGMREALRATKDRYRVLWQKRKGFARLAIEQQIPVILAACPRADDLYRVYETPLTKLSYKYLKVPIPLIRGFGLSFIPRPVQLTHYLSEPIIPPKKDPVQVESQVNFFHRKLFKEMTFLLNRRDTSQK